MFSFSAYQRKIVSMLIVMGLLCFASYSGAKTAKAQAQSLQKLLPDTQSLQGFSNVKPIEEQQHALDVLSLPKYNQDQAFSPSVTNDKITVDADATEWLQGWVKLPEHPGHFSQIMRSLYHDNGLYQLTITVNICDSSEAAEDELSQFLKGCSTRFRRGSFDTQSIIGDDSWYNPSGYSTLVFRCGRLMVEVDGSSTYNALRSGGYSAFPTAAVEAVAYQVLLRASQQTALTGVSTQNAHLAVNGHALPKNTLQVAGRTYVPVAEFAKAMGLTTQWNTKTGALTLSGAGRKTVTLTADSTAADVGAAKATLSVPVLKQDGQPVMTLEDLLAVTGGRIIGHSGDTVRVKG